MHISQVCSQDVQRQVPTDDKMVFEVADVTALPYQNDPFDVIFGLGVLYHLKRGRLGQK